VRETTSTSGKAWFAPIGTPPDSAGWTPIGDADITWDADEPMPVHDFPLNTWVRTEVTIPITKPTLLLARIFGVPPSLLGVPGYTREDARVRSAYRRRQLARRRRNRR
jgi:hypothetical protein